MATIVIACMSTGNAAEVPQDPSPVVIETAREMELSAELAIACGEYSSCFVDASTIDYSYFLARLAMTNQELQVAQNAAAGHAHMVIPRVNCLAKIGNLQAAMHLKNDYFKFHEFQVSSFFSCKVYCN